MNRYLYLEGMVEMLRTCRGAAAAMPDGSWADRLFDAAAQRLRLKRNDYLRREATGQKPCPG